MLKKANWLLRGFILVSCVIHFFVFLHITGLYRNSAMSYIELSMHEISKPDVRNIPRPRIRQKRPDVTKVNTITARKFSVPKIRIDRIQTDKMDNSYERISMPKLPDHMDTAGFSVPKLTIEKPAPPVPDIEPPEETIEFTSAKEYFDMLNLRIHSAKKYPESARSRHIEGRVKVGFVLHMDGSLSDVRVIKSSRHRNLDNAALEAVKNAAPLPRPPSFIFKEPVNLVVNILFELA